MRKLIQFVNALSRFYQNVKRSSGRIPKGFPPDLVNRTRAMLTLLNAAAELNDLRSPPGNHLENCPEIGTVNILYGSTNNIASASFGPMPVPMKLSSPTTIN